MTPKTVGIQYFLVKLIPNSAKFCKLQLFFSSDTASKQSHLPTNVNINSFLTVYSYLLQKMHTPDVYWENKYMSDGALSLYQYNWCYPSV